MFVPLFYWPEDTALSKLFIRVRIDRGGVKSFDFEDFAEFLERIRRSSVDAHEEASGGADDEREAG